MKLSYDIEETFNSLKMVRTKADKTQEQVADAIGVSRILVLKWENGTLKPGYNNLVRLYRYIHALAAEIKE